MSATDDYLEALYREGLRIRDEWFATYVANLNVLGRTLGTSQQFIADMRHLMPPPQPQAPLASEPEPPHAQQEFPRTPPPIPGMHGYVPPPMEGGTDEDFEARHYERQNRARDMEPGLDGVMGGRR